MLTLSNPRLWGFIPLLFFLLKWWQYRAPGEIYQLLWFCNAANLLLALALFIRWRNGVFICTVLLAIGLPIWIFDVIATGDFHVFSVFTHVFSPMIGLLAARQWGWNAHILWQTIAVYLLLQILARWLTPAAMNINVAFTVYAPVRSIFGNFWVYSAANLIGLFAWAWAAHRLLEKKQAAG